MNLTLDQRKEKARQLRAQGYSCSQCVTMVFDDVTGIDPSMLARMSAAFGGGVGGRGDMCGVVSGIAMVIGALRFNGPASKPSVHAEMSQLHSAFADNNGALTACRLLRTQQRKPCLQLIEEGIELLHNHICNA